MGFQCEKCGSNFVFENSLTRHLKTCKGPKKGYRRSIKCPECEQPFSKMSLLRSHIETIHEVKLETEEFLFLSLNDFRSWKEQLEKKELCYYFMKSVSKLPCDAKRTYFVCHRSGYFKSQSKGTRRLKSQGTNKLNSTCPSSMIVTEYSIGVKVSYLKTHFGHGSNEGRCRLTDRERAMIAGRISQGEPLDRILEELKNNEKNAFNGRASITKRYLHNIRRDFKLLRGDLSVDSSDPSSVDSSKNEEILKGHERGVKIKPSKIEKLTENTWKVKSMSKHKPFYEVVKTKDRCDEEMCQFKCKACFSSPCVHTYTCECRNYNATKSNICEHIHACISHESNDEPINSALIESPDNFLGVEVTLCAEEIYDINVEKKEQMHEDEEKELMHENFINNLNSMLQIYKNVKESLTTEDYRQLNTEIDSVLNVLRQREKHHLCYE